MRKAQLREIFFSVLFLILFLLSLSAISHLSNERTSDYTSSWEGLAGAMFITVFVAIPTLMLSVFFAIAALMNELKIYNDKRMKKL
jgi:hypothetical protein